MYNLSIDFSALPRHPSGRISWKKSIGKKIHYSYKNNEIIGDLLIKDYSKKKVLCLNIRTNEEKWCDCKTLLYGEYILFYIPNYHELTRKNKYKKIEYKTSYEYISDKDNTIKYQGNNKTIRQKYKIGETIITPKHLYKICGITYRICHNYDKDIYGGKIFYTVLCNDCKQTHLRSQYEIKKGACPYCSNYEVCEGYNDIPSTTPWMIPYFQGGIEEAKQYAAKSAHKIIPKCPNCGYIHDKKVSIVNLYNYHGFKCKCSDNISFPEKFMIGLLDQLNIDYIYQAQTTELGFDTQGKIYDFYIPSIKCIIETHGSQHYRGENVFHTSFEKQQANDKFKEQLAKENRIKHYIQIDCSQTTLVWLKEHIINSDISQLFNLSSIDWKKCVKRGASNLVKEVCDYYNTHDVNINKISQKFHIGHKGIRNYLKRGSELGWCKYKPNQSFFTCKPFTVFKDNKFICYGESAKSLGCKSKEVLGEYISSSTIRKCLTGNLQSFKGYQFNYIEDLNLKREVLCNLL